MTQEQKPSTEKGADAEKADDGKEAATYGGDGAATYGDKPAGESPEPEQGDDQAVKLRKEAASYRRKLREAEGERDQLAAMLAAARRAEVERALSAHLADPQDLLSGIEDLDTFYVEDKLDPAAVKRQAEAAIESKPHWRKPPPPTRMDGGVREMPPAGPPSFGEALRRAAGH